MSCVKLFLLLGSCLFHSKKQQRRCAQTEVRQDADENGENRSRLCCTIFIVTITISSPLLLRSKPTSLLPHLLIFFSLDIQSLSFRTVMQNHSKFLQNGFLLSLKKIAQILWGGNDSRRWSVKSRHWSTTFGSQETMASSSSSSSFSSFSFCWVVVIW
jgi:hypothetical protein